MPATSVEARTLEIPYGTDIFTIWRLRFVDRVLEQPLGGSLYELLRVRYGLTAL